MPFFYQLKIYSVWFKRDGGGCTHDGTSLPKNVFFFFFIKLCGVTLKKMLKVKILNFF